VATSRPALEHAVDQPHPHLPVAVRRPGPAGVLARGLVLGATAAPALTLLPGTAAADPEEATSAGQAAQLVARAAHDLEVPTEQVDEARETSAQPQAAVQSADRAAAETQAQLDALDGHVRQVARAAFPASGNGMAELDLLMTSGSVEELVYRLPPSTRSPGTPTRCSGRSPSPPPRRSSPAPRQTPPGPPRSGRSTTSPPARPGSRRTSRSTRRGTTRCRRRWRS
jgi:hypothetical protein